ncbi:Putative oxidoreductase [Fulvia fulva]|uniref:Oxidoreductase n=1 Tax=Passalora fulva TaxID=5499 RepID=A0A9Q8URK4_PASFU|nr:Putative oxidoreductase [Fulvia fulva]UJO19899.1 Putative oxidoreductase [Fulvia fulva]
MPSTPSRSNDQAGASGTVILGAGIIGCATAYYLSQSATTRPDSIHLVEASDGLFDSASGKSGGFIAEDWFGPATASLGRLSFQLHQELADEHNGRQNWGYSRSTGISLVDGGGRSSSGGRQDTEWLANGTSRAQAAQDPGVHEFVSGNGPSWLRKRDGDAVDHIGEEGGVAQVDPLRLSHFLLDQCTSRGVHLHHPARAVQITTDPTGILSGITLRDSDSDDTEHHIPCTRLLISASAWTPQIFASLFRSSPTTIAVTPYAGHSIVVKSPRWTREHETRGCHALLTTMQNSFSPEIFSRVGEEIYIAGLNDSDLPLPEKASEAVPDPEAIEDLIAVAHTLPGRDGTDVSDLEVLREGLCFRPVTRSGAPILTRMEDKELGGMRMAEDGGVYVCAGPGPWGISLGLETGLVMSEMIEGKRTSADVRRLGLR